MTIITAESTAPSGVDAADHDPTRGPTWDDFHALEERLENRAIRFTTWTVFIWAFAGVALIFSIIGIGFGLRGTKPSAVAPAPVTSAPSPGPVTLSDFKVHLTAATVAPGTVTFQVNNAGTVQHELLVFRSDLPPSAYPLQNGNIDEEGPGITKVSDADNIDPGAAQTRTVDLTHPGTYLFVCNLPGHFKAGMYAVVTVK